MRRTDRTRALHAAWIQLWWLLDPAHTRWAKTLEVLADPASRLTIEQGSGDHVGRRSKGDHSDPTHAQAAAVIDAGLDCQRQARTLRRAEADIAESAATIRSIIAGEPWGWSDLTSAIHDIAWCSTAPHTSAAWTTDDDELRAELDHAHDHLARQAAHLASQCRAILASAVKERPQVTQPRLVECRAHRAWAKSTGKQGRQPLAAKHGLCERCATFRHHHKVDPTPAILTRWDAGQNATPPGLVLEAKAAARTRKRKTG